MFGPPNGFQVRNLYLFGDARFSSVFGWGRERFRLKSVGAGLNAYLLSYGSKYIISQDRTGTDKGFPTV